MANVDNTKHSALHILGTNGFKIENFIDGVALAPSANDVIQCVNVNEGMLITRVSILTVVAEGANTNGYDVGDGDSTEAWDASESLNNTAGGIKRSLEASDTYGVGRYYTTDDTIDFIPLDDVDTGKWLMIVEGVRIEDPTVISTL